ncbi:MAG: carbohydrate-binding protein [Pirellulales bacterium]|nr:carbohydrate-binding protein [Pirellulales bacterium]
MRAYRTMLACLVAGIAVPAFAAELHVATTGRDSAAGTASAPLRTIQKAADLAQPGDTITVHEGVYRERVNPPRGGESDDNRIIYQAAPGEQVEIKGSEVVSGWEKVRDDVWKVTLPSDFFGDFNPFDDLIRGDWFNPSGREHHAGAVYLDGDWLTEAATLDEVLMPGGMKPAWLSGAPQEYLLNVAWLRPGADAGQSARVPAHGFAEQHGIQTADCSEGDKCIGWIEPGDWVRYDGVDLGTRCEQIEIRAASVTGGGLIEIRLDTPEGDLLGTCNVTTTGDWQKWASFSAKIRPTGGKKNLCLLFRNREPDEDSLKARSLNPQLWFARVNETDTTIWAQFAGVDPNRHLVEVNVRQSVFYPDQPGSNYITVRGFTMRHAATPWAPPTAEQIGLLGTHWSKGWVIENNVISHSICTGITLGKHGDKYDNTSADTAEGYVKTIERAHAFVIPWTKENIGHHVVRNNTISHCEQAGIVGSLGAAFSTIEGNIIHDIHLRHLFTGAEMSGIKIHAAIDATIRRNHIYRCSMGLWLDWMAQGTRVSRNLFHDNTGQDLFVEVNHGPFVVDNNLFLSSVSLLDMSEGGAYAHNLFGGRIVNCPEPNRETPYHPAHTTTVAGLAVTTGGDDRFYNNVFVGDGETVPESQRGDLTGRRWISSHGLWGYDGREFPLQTGGNVYCFGAEPYAKEANPIMRSDYNPNIKLIEEAGKVSITFETDELPSNSGTSVVTTKMLGEATVPKLRYENADRTPLTIDTDYFGKRRNEPHPWPGPFANLRSGSTKFQVW